ncbi:MAG TPA: PKD domain-containing protein [Thermoanaerobaculia bacterium]
MPAPAWMAVFVSLLVLWPLAAAGANFELEVLLDIDNNAATGCTVALPTGAPLSGIDIQLTTTVAADDGSGAGQVTGVVAASCVPATGTFGSPLTVDTRRWNAAGPNLVVETRLPYQQLRVMVPGFAPGRVVRLAFVAQPVAASGGDAIVSEEGGPILHPPPPRRRRPAGPARAIALDGNGNDWSGLESLAADPAQYRGTIRLARAFVTSGSDGLYFRFDAGIGGGTFRPLPEAFPLTGPAPLTVTFVTKAEYEDVQILRYRWDFEGDGVFDTNDPGAKNYTRTFTTPGVRNAVLEVMNERNQLSTATVRVTVTGRPPSASASVSPSNGPAPLTVTLTGTATPGSAPIAKYEWDYDGDGRFDHSSTTSGTATHAYTAARTYYAIFRVTDTAGLTATASTTATAIRTGPPGSPTATITSPGGPSSRTTPAVITFAGTGSTPSGSITKYEWDFDGNGSWDYSSATSASTVRTYNSPGSFTAALRVTNSAGQTGIDTVDINVDMTVFVTLSGDTLRPPSTVAVQTTMLGTAPVSIFIRDREGTTVRRLVNNVTRAGGSYVDAWNGRDDAGALVREGVYYAVVQYLANGAPRVIDASKTTGGSFYNPPWTLSTTAHGDCQNCVFAPYDDDFLQATFRVPTASEVTVSIRAYDTANEVSLLFDRRLFGSGKDYKVVWEGTDAKGRIVNPEMFGEDQFIFGMTAFTLPDNAIFVELAPELTDVTITPNYYDPYTRDFLNPQRAPATVEYTLSKAALVRLQVFRVGTNVLLRTVERPNSPAGKATIAWDGRDDRGIFADEGEYRLALLAIDAAGHQSLIRYGLLKVFY